MTHKFFKPALALSLMFVAGLTFYVLTSHSVSGEESKNAPAWSVRCGEQGDVSSPEKGKCEIFQRLVVNETGQRLTEFAIGYSGENLDQMRGIVILPLGILLETGVALQIDDKEPFSFTPRYCDAGGCVAFLNMNDKILGMMRKGDTARVTMKALNGSDINVEMPLKGFSKALGQIK